jgi:sugar phosphate isomerase/epimerase
MGHLIDDERLIISFFTLSGAPPPQQARHSFEARVRAASDAGFYGLGMLREDFQALRAAGYTRARLQAVLDQAGIAIRELEFLPTWYLPSEAAENARYEPVMWEMAEVFGAHQLNVGMMTPPGHMPPQDLVTEQFAALCDRAADHGVTIALEAMATSCLQSPLTAWEIVRDAGRENAGLLVDAYHLLRAGVSIDELQALPARHIVGVQISDAPGELEGDLGDESTNRRLLPGDGDLDLVNVLRTLDEMGVDAPVAVEVMSADLRAKPADEIAWSAARAARAVMART